MAVTKPLGAYMFRVFEGDQQPLPQRARARSSGCSTAVRRRPDSMSRPGRSTRSRCWPSALFGVLVTYAHSAARSTCCRFNPQGFGRWSRTSAFNTAASFTTNTNWQSYAGESTMSYLTQMAGLAWHNFTSAAAGIGVALALARGFTRRPGPEGPRRSATSGSISCGRSSTCCCPCAIVFALLLVVAGRDPEPRALPRLTTLEGAQADLAHGPGGLAGGDQELGHQRRRLLQRQQRPPVREPHAAHQLRSDVLHLRHPAALTYTYGRMARDPRQGWALFGAMASSSSPAWPSAYCGRGAGQPGLAGRRIDQAGNMEGKEVRFGVSASALFATVDHGCLVRRGQRHARQLHPARAAWCPRQHPARRGHLRRLARASTECWSIVVLTVFIAGLMVGRTPEYLGKKIEAREMKLAMLYVLIFPLVILGLAAWAAVVP